MSATPPVLQVEQSATQFAKLVLGGVVLTALSGALVAPGENAVMTVVGAVGLAFFGASTVIVIYRFLSLRGPVLTIDADGIHDVRVSRLPLLWGEVRSIRVWELNHQRVLVLNVEDRVWDEIGVLTLPRRARGANRALGADGLAFTAQSLSITLEEMVGAARAAYAFRAGSPAR